MNTQTQSLVLTLHLFVPLRSPVHQHGDVNNAGACSCFCYGHYSCLLFFVIGLRKCFVRVVRRDGLLDKTSKRFLAANKWDCGILEIVISDIALWYFGD